jgi:hypothetical protein
MAGAKRGGQAGGMTRLRPVLLALTLTFTLGGGLVQPTDALSTSGSIRFPGLGRSGGETLSGTVYNWGCRGGEIGSRIYRWGCAGERNRYLLGHAHASFEELHDFVAARGVAAGTQALVGKAVWLRTATGRTLQFRVAWARVASVAYWGRTGELWAWNATDVPSITFQTCYGARSEYRLIVRAERVG